MSYVFYILAIWTIGSGLMAVVQRNLVHCALALIAFFAGIAGIFFSLHAEFLGAVQIIVYVGAVAVLILFALMLTQRITGNEPASPFSAGAIWGWTTGLMVLGVLIYTIQKTGKPIGAETPPILTVAEIGQAFMTRYAVPFEVISLLLTAALVGAIVMALEEPRHKS